MKPFRADARRSSGGKEGKWLMGPIQPLGFHRPALIDRPGSIGEPTPGGANAGVGGINLSVTSADISSTQSSVSSISALSISSNVSQLLNSIGGGVQDNKMLELMIALMIIMALLGQQQGGTSQGSEASALDRLGGASTGLQINSSSYSSSSISYQHTSITFSGTAAETFDALRQGGETENQAGKRFDSTA